MAQTVQDSADVFYRHLEINELTVTGLTGQSRLKEMPAPVSIVSQRDLQATASTNIIDAIARQPGISQITTGGGISKPVIRGLGFNRVAVISDGVRQEGQQWGDEHGVEVDGQAVGQVEILKGPYSLMYGSDAMAGVLILHPRYALPLGQTQVNVTTEYQTNNGLWGYSADFAGNRQGMVWDGRWSQKQAHSYKSPRDGYVAGSQFCEQSARMMLGANRRWGHSHLTATYYHLTPSIIEGDQGLYPDETDGGGPKTYSKTLPFQQVYHYKLVSENMFGLGDDGQLKLTLAYQQNRRQEYEESPDEYGLYFRLHTMNYDLRYLMSAAGGWRLAAGLGGMWQRSQNLGDEFLIPSYSLFDAGIFSTVSRQVGCWNLVGGVRIDRRTLHSHALSDNGTWRFEAFRRHFVGLSASFGAVCNLTPQLDLRANVSRGFRAPNMSEMGSNGVHEGTARYERGNRYLHAEHSLQFDLGLDFSSNHLSAQLALFANRIDNYIYLHRTAGEVSDGEGDIYPVYSYGDGDARILGFEAMVDIHPLHRIHFENTFSMVDAVQMHQPHISIYLPFTPAPRWTSELKYEITHKGRMLNNTYVSLCTECFLRQGHCHWADGTETATPSYTLLHFEGGTDVNLRGRHVASLYLTASNLLNRAYQNHLSRLKYIETNPSTGRQGLCNMGRNMVMKLVVPIQL